MKYFSIVLIGSFLVLIDSRAYGQINFSQYSNNSLLINPSYTGHFNNDIRIGGSFRNQRGAQGQIFNKSTFGVEAKLFKQKIDNFDCFAVGINAVKDYGDNSGIDNTSLLLSTAFKKSLSEDGLQFLSAGFQLSYSSFKLIKPNNVFEDQILTWGNFGYSNIDPFALNNFQVNYFDFNVGLAYHGFIDSKNKFSVGGSILNITKPKKVFQGGELNIQQQIWGHLGWEKEINDIDRLNASVLMGYQSKQVNNFMSGLIYNKGIKKKTSISLGAIYKNTNQFGVFLVPQIGLKFKDIDLVLSNDISVSQKRSSQRDAFEISMRYFLARSREGFLEKKFTNF